MDKIIIKACLNGGRGREQNPNVPWTPEEIAAEAKRCHEAGAAAVHFHARTPQGGASYDTAWYARADALIRERCPIITNHTTARSWETPIESVLAYLRDTPEPVDMVSLNMGHMVSARKDPSTGKRRTVTSPNAYEEIAAVLDICYQRGTLAEPAVFDLGYLNNAITMVNDGVLKHTHYFLVEVLGEWGGGQQKAPGTPRHYQQLTQAIREFFPSAIWIGHSTGERSLQMAAYVIADGAHLRIGFEDWPLLPGRGPASHADMVAGAVKIARALGREPATPEEARKALRIPLKVA